MRAVAHGLGAYVTLRRTLRERHVALAGGEGHSRAWRLSRDQRDQHDQCDQRYQRELR